MQETKTTESIWYLDNACSRHMIGNKCLLSNFKEKDGPAIIFRNNNSGKVEGYGMIGNGVVSSSEVAFIEGLKHNLPSISQLCDKGHQVISLNNQC